jgi:hypothetical protein
MNADSDVTQLDDSEALRLLASEERRRLLVELHERDSEELPLGYDDVVELVRTADDASVATGPSSKETAGTDQHEIELYHNHLPKLAAKSVISWNETAETITPGSAFEDLRPFVKWFAARRDDETEE